MTLPVTVENHLHDTTKAAHNDVKHGFKYIIDKCAQVVESLGLSIDSSTSQNDCLEVKPVIELAFSKVRVRSVVKYESTDMGSKKLMIAEQAFDIRMGWSSRDNIRMLISTNENVNNVQIYAPPPHVLTTTPVEQTPHILLEEDGYLNKFTSDDYSEVGLRLKNEALASADWEEGRRVAIDGFEKFLKGLFQLQGFNVELHYTNNIPKG